MTIAADGYYGQPVLKQPVWTWEIPVYFFTGGLGGAAAGLAYGHHLRGETVAARAAWSVSLAALGVSPALLISDLGRPARFLNMLRMFKITSPMSVGSWALSVTGGATGVAALDALGVPIPGVVAAPARPVAALGGLSVATYTAALLANTAVPAWHEARWTLPLVFASGAAMSAGGACAAVTPGAEAGAARRLALVGAGAELVTTELMHRRLGEQGWVYRQGAAARWSRAGQVAILAGAAMMGRAKRGHAVTAVAGALLCAGALATRLSVVAAGHASAADPRSVIAPQARRRGGSGTGGVRPPAVDGARSTGGRSPDDGACG